MRGAINLGIRDADVSVLLQFEAEGIERGGYSHEDDFATDAQAGLLILKTALKKYDQIPA